MQTQNGKLNLVSPLESVPLRAPRFMLPLRLTCTCAVGPGSMLALLRACEPRMPRLLRWLSRTSRARSTNASASVSRNSVQPSAATTITAEFDSGTGHFVKGGDWNWSAFVAAVDILAVEDGFTMLLVVVLMNSKGFADIMNLTDRTL